MEKMQRLIEEVINTNLNKNKSKKHLDSFIKEFYSHSFSQDFTSYSKEDLYLLALSNFNLFSNKKAGQFKIKLYNPTIKEDGFCSDYTILDIVNDDKSFLVDSIVIQFDNLGVGIKNIIHPIISTDRSDNGDLVDLVTLGSGNDESVIQLHLERISSKSRLKEIEKSLSQILETVSIVVADWPKMVDMARESEIKIGNSRNSPPKIKEVKSFIEWAINNSFIFLGAVEYDVENKNGEYSLKQVVDSKLGIFRSKHKNIVPDIFNRSSKDIESSVKNPYLIEILKSRYKSQIHRSTNTERIRIQKFDEDGNVTGEYRFIGLFTSSVYYQSADLIPIIRKKIKRVILESGFGRKSHSSKDLISVLESYPRDELFQIEHDDLFMISMGIVAISGRSLVRFFVRKDKFSRFVSCLVFVPRDHYNTALKEKVQDTLSTIYKGEITGSYAQITDSNLTRLHLIIRTDNGIPNVSSKKVEQELISACKVWSDKLEDEILNNFPREETENIINDYRDAFLVSYTERFSARAAVFDIKGINESLSKNGLVCDLYKSASFSKDTIEIKIYSPKEGLHLSDIMPILDSFSFNVIHEHTYVVSPKGKKNVWIHYFNINLSKDKLTEVIKKNFEETIDKIWENKTQIGHLNRLVIAANSNYRQVYLIRAYTRFLYQAGLRYSQKYISDVLVGYHEITKLIIELFEVKFDPQDTKDREGRVENIRNKIIKNINKVSDSTDDIIIRRFFNAVDNTVRTNFFQKDLKGNFKDYVSFKFDCSKIIGLPLPIPHAEIFVLSTQMEAIHLRGGKVARGGLRWSDRPEDFRTEVLGLMKAQMTKNAVIVPVGSKGGFVVKENTANMDRNEVLSVAIQCYKTFLRGMLDVTDNIVNGRIIYPKNVVRYDGPDPYLVVAADKGTATFSDIANEISAEYNFWLGDAFASGGSVGYDHKKMGITAKGAWVSVARHFSEMGVDIQKEDFTCVGIGDMSGDVFGNGMLLSEHIRLVAAFNHMHIFLDPNPNSATSFKERSRMFNLPRSSWEDYDKKLISKGGGIFSRSAKTIVLSKEIRELLKIEDNELKPNQLISAILKAPVDLLWNGGIGTYCKEKGESHLEVGDRVNDNIRVNGEELRCKVIGEGGNLGFTQKGRIEYTMNGGRMNTDAMDNSAGVDCSDREVNIKIALTQAMKSGKVSLVDRNKILESMTQEVSNLVLEDNRLQTQAISIAHSQGYLALGDQAQFLDKLEDIGLLNRQVEFLPSRKELGKRQSEKIGMTHPELCVMLSYSKMHLYSQILNSNLVKNKYFEGELFDYFPKIMQKKFADEISHHQLRSEIIATQITNLIVNRLGVNFINKIAQDNGFLAVDIVRSFMIVYESFGLKKVWSDIEDLDGRVSRDVQMDMFNDTNKMIERTILWLLRNGKRSKDIVAVSGQYKKQIDKLFDILEEILAAVSKHSYDKKVARYIDKKVPEELAKKISAMIPLGSSYDIIAIANKLNFDIKTVSKIYYIVGNRMHLKWLRMQVSDMKIENHWQKLSAKTILEDLYSYQTQITKKAIEHSCKGKASCSISPCLSSWVENYSFLVDRYDSFIADLKSQANPDLPMFVVALNRLKALIS